MPELKAELNLSEMDGFAEQVARELEAGDDVDVEIPHDIFDPFGEDMQELAEWLETVGVVDSYKLTELDIQIRYGDGTVKVTHVREADD